MKHFYRRTLESYNSKEAVERYALKLLPERKIHDTMIDPALEAIVERREQRPVPLHALMPKRVREILLVSSLYDSFTFEEDGRLAELLISEYLELNLRYAPRIERVSTAEAALNKLRQQEFDHLHMPYLRGMVQGGLERVPCFVDVRSSFNQ